MHCVILGQFFPRTRHCRWWLSSEFCGTALIPGGFPWPSASELVLASSTVEHLRCWRTDAKGVMPSWNLSKLHHQVGHRCTLSNKAWPHPRRLSQSCSFPRCSALTLQVVMVVCFLPVCFIGFWSPHRMKPFCNQSFFVFSVPCSDSSVGSVTRLASAAVVSVFSRRSGSDLCNRMSVFTQMITALVHQRSYHKTPPPGCLINNRTFFLNVLEAEPPRSRCKQGQVPMTALFRGAVCHLLAVSSHRGREERFSWSLLSKGANPIMDATRATQSLFKAPPPNAIVLGLRFLAYEFGENTTFSL